MPSSKREFAISDQWTISKSKLAFLAAVSELEAYAMNQDQREYLDNDSAWGRHYVLQEIFEEMEKVINGDMPELREVTNG